MIIQTTLIVERYLFFCSLIYIFLSMELPCHMDWEKIKCFGESRPSPSFGGELKYLNTWGEFPVDMRRTFEQSSAFWPWIEVFVSFSCVGWWTNDYLEGHRWTKNGCGERGNRSLPQFLAIVVSANTAFTPMGRGLFPDSSLGHEHENEDLEGFLQCSKWNSSLAIRSQ